ncbi:FYVE zinc finger domain-containing protein [Babesia caballi]|uniref:FYVE zinc finger domain-containing protein n=1 Tax=Babesia caballi TaxID=5871 RepID=A0AAV4LUQ8_BABCB|nr:FYVE zinc finger domain-containing protein [Babesia caballi]
MAAAGTAAMREPQGCEICGAAFTLISRGRACPQCKRRCCLKCLDASYVSPRSARQRHGGPDPPGACADCMLADAAHHSISVQEELDVTEEINRGLKSELKRQVAAMERFRGFLVEFCEAFAPESALFADAPAPSRADTAEQLDPEAPIAALVDRGRDTLQNLHAGMRRLRADLDAARGEGAELRREVADSRAQLEALADERDGLQRSLHRVNEALLGLEAERQQVADLRRECAALRARCRKMEQAQLAASGQFGTASLLAALAELRLAGLQLLGEAAVLLLAGLERLRGRGVAALEELEVVVRLGKPGLQPLKLAAEALHVLLGALLRGAQRRDRALLGAAAAGELVHLGLPLLQLPPALGGLLPAAREVALELAVLRHERDQHAVHALHLGVQLVHLLGQAAVVALHGAQALERPVALLQLPLQPRHLRLQPLAVRGGGAQVIGGLLVLGRELAQRLVQLADLRAEAGAVAVQLLRLRGGRAQLGLDAHELRPRALRLLAVLLGELLQLLRGGRLVLLQLVGLRVQARLALEHLLALSGQLGLVLLDELLAQPLVGGALGAEQRVDQVLLARLAGHVERRDCRMHAQQPGHPGAAGRVGQAGAAAERAQKLPLAREAARSVVLPHPGIRRRVLPQNPQDVRAHLHGAAQGARHQSPGVHAVRLVPHQRVVGDQLGRDVAHAEQLVQRFARGGGGGQRHQAQVLCRHVLHVLDQVRQPAGLHERLEQRHLGHEPVGVRHGGPRALFEPDRGEQVAHEGVELLPVQRLGHVGGQQNAPHDHGHYDLDRPQAEQRHVQKGFHRVGQRLRVLLQHARGAGHRVGDDRQGVGAEVEEQVEHLQERHGQVVPLLVDEVAGVQHEDGVDVLRIHVVRDVVDESLVAQAEGQHAGHGPELQHAVAARHVAEEQPRDGVPALRKLARAEPHVRAVHPQQQRPPAVGLLQRQAERLHSLLQQVRVVELDAVGQEGIQQAEVHGKHGDGVGQHVRVHGGDGDSRVAHVRGEVADPVEPRQHGQGGNGGHVVARGEARFDNVFEGRPLRPARSRAQRLGAVVVGVQQPLAVLPQQHLALRGVEVPAAVGVVLELPQLHLAEQLARRLPHKRAAVIERALFAIGLHAREAGLWRTDAIHVVGGAAARRPSGRPRFTILDHTVSRRVRVSAVHARILVGGGLR